MLQELGLVKSCLRAHKNKSCVTLAMPELRAKPAEGIFLVLHGSLNQQRISMRISAEIED